MGRPQIQPVFLDPVFPRPHGNKLRQIIVQTAQPIMNPRPQRRKLAVQHVAPRVKLSLCPMVAVGRVHRSYDGQTIDMLGNLRKPVADLNAALPMLFKAHLQRIQRVPLVAIGVRHQQPLQRQPRWILGRRKRRLRNRLARIPVQHRLGIETLHVADPAIHEKPNHALRFRHRLRQPVRRRPQRSLRPALALHHGPQGQPGKTKTNISKEMTAIHATRSGKVHRSTLGDKIIVINQRPHQMSPHRHLGNRWL